MPPPPPRPRSPRPADRRPAAPPVAGLDARRAALARIEAALARRGGGDDEASGEAGLDGRDRAFARALASAVLRRTAALDRVLDARLQRPPPPAVRALLRLGLAQLAVLETPAFAAVSTTLALAEAAPATRPFRGLLNAVLRGLDRDGAPALLAAQPAQVDVPDWLLARWRATHGEAGAQALAAAVRVEPPTDLTLRDGPQTAAPAQEMAQALAAELEGVVLPTGSVRTPRRGELAGWPGYGDGRWWVQDAAAAVPARLLAVLPGETALDLCAAPGGKTLQLAAAGARVTALDRSAARLARVGENLQRTGLAAELVAADAGAWSDPRRFDAVLLDAPCSATGTFRRHPDVLHLVRPADIAGLAAAQARLLDAAAARVAPGGRLVFCTCSLEPEEGEAQAAAFLRRAPEFRLAPVDPAALGLPETAAAPSGGLRLTPALWEHEGGMDGFYAVRFDRAG